MLYLRVIGFVLFAGLAAAQTLAVEGAGGSSAKLSLADLAAMPQQTVTVDEHGKSVAFTGVALKDVLAKVTLPTGEQYHHTAASYYMVVEAADGYHAVFAWAELDPSFNDKAVYVVTKRDGQPLSEKEGPFRLVAPGEKRGARWVHQVTGLRLVQAK